MRHLIPAAALLALPLSLSAPALAAEPAVAVRADPAAGDGAMQDAARALGDPARQRALAQAIGTMAEVMLDLPLAPIIRPLAEAAGQNPGRIDPDTTLRRVAPGAGAVSRQVERDLPRAMGAMGASMAGLDRVFAALQPALRDAAERVGRAMAGGRADGTDGPRPGEPVDIDRPAPPAPARR